MIPADPWAGFLVGVAIVMVPVALVWVWYIVGEWRFDAAKREEFRRGIADGSIPTYWAEVD